MRLKLCEPGDLAALMELGRTFHAELSEYHLPLDERKAALATARSIANALALAVEDDDGGLSGALIMNHDMPWYSSQPALWEIGFYVRPGKRASRAAGLLLDAAKAIAADMQLPLFATPFSGIAVDRKDKLFERSGFARLGSIYRWG